MSSTSHLARRLQRQNETVTLLGNETYILRTKYQEEQQKTRELRQENNMLKREVDDLRKMVAVYSNDLGPRIAELEKSREDIQREQKRLKIMAYGKGPTSRSSA